MSIAKYRKLDLFLLLLAMGTIMVLADKTQAYPQSQVETQRESNFPGWRTNTASGGLFINVLLGDCYLIFGHIHPVHESMLAREF